MENLNLFIDKITENIKKFYSLLCIEKNKSIILVIFNGFSY